MSLLEVDDLRVEFRIDTGVVPAVNGVSLSVEPGRTVAIVGESGSGKTATALSVLRLNPEPPCVYVSGEIRFEGRNLLTLAPRALRQVRGAGIAMVFQDPMTSLNPVRTVGAQIAEAVRRHMGLSRSEARQQVVTALREVGIANPEDRAGQYPHQFSGGMRQRVMIAMALACRPKILIADEPTTALDVTVQAQILELLGELKQRTGMAIVLITHDLGMVAQTAEDVVVMYAGRVMERGPADALFERPMAAYTAALLSSVPRADRPGSAISAPIPGSPPDLRRPPPGCAFAPRCALAGPDCDEAIPALLTKEAGHDAACLRSPAELAALSTGASVATSEAP